MCVERLKREEQGRLEQEKWKRRMESESVEAQEQLSDLGMLAAELRGSLAQKEKEITILQGRWDIGQENNTNKRFFILQSTLYSFILCFCQVGGRRGTSCWSSEGTERGHVPGVWAERGSGEWERDEGKGRKTEARPRGGAGGFENWAGGHFGHHSCPAGAQVNDNRNYKFISVLNMKGSYYVSVVRLRLKKKEH